MKINTNNQTFYKYLWTLLGFIFVILFIWLRFLRERLPRDIPFNLNWISFSVLVFICLIYAFVTFKTLKLKLLENKYSRYYYIFEYLFKKNNNNSFLSSHNMQNIILFIFNKIKGLITPLVVFHNFLIIDLNLQSFCINLFLHFNHKYKLYDSNQNEKAFLLLDFFPKFIMLLFFLSDVFYFKKLHIFYYTLFLGIIPLIYSYLAYIWKAYLEILIKELENNYYVKILSTKEEEETYEKHLEGMVFMVSLNSLKYEDDDFELLNVRYFIKIQSCNILFEFYLYKYACVETDYAREAYAEKHKIKLPTLRLMEPGEDYISRELAAYFYAHIEIAIYLYVFKETHENISKPHVLKNYLLYIYIGYLIGWTYILFSTLDTFTMEQFIKVFQPIIERLKLTFIEVEEPFSQLIINDIEKKIEAIKKWFL